MRSFIRTIIGTVALVTLSLPLAHAQPAEWYQGFSINAMPGQSTPTSGVTNSLDEAEGSAAVDAAVEEMANQAARTNGSTRTNQTTDTGSVWDNTDSTDDLVDPAEFKRKELRISREADLERLILKGVLFFQGFLGAILVMMMIYGGYLMLWSVGNEERFTKGRMVVMNSIIGFIIVILSYAIITTLLSSTSVLRTIFAIFGR